jgi:hypothetical protein
MRRIDALIRAAEGNRPDEELKEALQALVADFHPHSAPVSDVAAASQPVPLAVN